MFFGVSSKIAGAALACALFVPVAAVAQPRYKITAITPPPEFGQSGVQGLPRINNNSVVVGTLERSYDCGFNGCQTEFLPYSFQAGVFTDLRPLAADLSLNLSHVLGLGISNHNQIASCTLIPRSGYVAVLLRDGAVMFLQEPVEPRAFHSCAAAVNDFGQVAGTTSGVAGTTSGSAGPRAFLYSDGVMLDLGVPPGRSNTKARDLNNLGQVVGVADEFGFTQGRAFLYSGGQMIDLGAVISTHQQSMANSINDAGQIVGWSGGLDSQRAFLYSDGQVTFLPYMTAAPHGSEATAINNLGQVVGWARLPPSEAVDFRAIHYSNGITRDLNDLIPPGSGWVLKSATDINDRGQIVGVGEKDGKFMPFLLSPQKTSFTRQRPRRAVS